MRIEVTLDCRDPDRLAEFLASALSYVRQPAAAEGYVSVEPPAGRDGFTLTMQRVPEPKRGKNRMHLDLLVENPDQELDRLEALGASRLGSGWLEKHGERWIVLADPEGNEFCLAADTSTP